MIENPPILPRILLLVFLIGGFLLSNILVSVFGLAISSFWALVILLAVCVVPACICLDIILDPQSVGRWTVWVTSWIFADRGIRSLIEFRHARGLWLNVSLSSGIWKWAIFLLGFMLSYLIMRFFLVFKASSIRAKGRSKGSADEEDVVQEKATTTGGAGDNCVGDARLVE